MKIIKIDQHNPHEFSNKLNQCDAVVKFFSPNCGHCNAMEGEWNKMTKRMKSKKCKKDACIFEVNGEASGQINHPIMQQIQGYPTIVKTTNGSFSPEHDMYQGERNANEMYKWVIQKFKKHLKQHHNSTRKQSNKRVRRPRVKKQSKQSKKKSRSK